jgi:hypothetical protein
MHQGVPLAGQHNQWSLLSPLDILSIRCEIPLHLAGRWGFETTSKQGAATLSSVLKSDRAVQVNIQIMRAFIKMRQMYISHEDLKQKIIAMERKYDKQFQIVFKTIKQLEPVSKMHLIPNGGVAPLVYAGFHACFMNIKEFIKSP